MTYKILSLDGGGAWAIIEVMALMQIFGDEAKGHDILEKFDLVAANSGGSIVLGGLMENLPLGTVLSYFNDQAKRQSIFSPTDSWGDKALELLLKIGPKYSAAAKLPALERLMPKTGNSPVQGITAGVRGPAGKPVRLMIVGFDYDRNRAAFFRSVPANGPALGVTYPASITLAEAIHASTNAPINYFDAPAAFPERPERYWDGGVSGFNNPVLAAVTEALTLGVPPTAIAALSLGTASVQLLPGAAGQAASPYYNAWQSSSLVNDLQKMAASILDDPPDSASFIAHVLTQGAGGFPAPAVSRVVRMNPSVAPAFNAQNQPIPPGGMTPAAFQALCKINMDAVQQTEVDAITAYAKLWLANDAPNQFIHTDGATPPTTLGYKTFAEALAAWQALIQDGPQDTV